jgi:hypothetical protein
MSLGGSVMGARRVAMATLVVGALWTRWGQASPSVPLFLTEQGRLTDATGTPVTTSTKLTFNIYLLATAGVTKWTEVQTLTPDAGYFSAELGSVTAFPAGLFSGVELYLGVTVGTDPEMKPRQKITSVPYALVSNNAIGDITPNSVTTTGSITTTGTATIGGVLAANGGVSVGGTSIIDTSGNWVGPPPVASPIVGYASTDFSYYVPSPYGQVNINVGSFTPTFNGTCVLTTTFSPRDPYPGVPGTSDYAYAYPLVNGSLTGNYCYTPYPAGANESYANCTNFASVAVTSGTLYEVGCYTYASAGWVGASLSCAVVWVCAPS